MILCLHPPKSSVTSAKNCMWLPLRPQPPRSVPERSAFRLSLLQLERGSHLGSGAPQHSAFRRVAALIALPFRRSLEASAGWRGSHIQFFARLSEDACFCRHNECAETACLIYWNYTRHQTRR